MAKVTGPLFSISASGKLADAMVHFGWKGTNVVRQWLKPAQPRPVAVMNMRIKYKALGKVSKAFTPASTLRAALIAKTPPGSVWNADWIGVAIKEFQKDNTAYDALLTDFQAATSGSQIWRNQAERLGLADVALEVEGKAADHPVLYGMPMALYSLTKACWYREVLDEGEVKYTDPATWEAAAIEAFTNRILD